MYHYNDEFIFVNDRPVGYSKDVSIEELERHGFTRITVPFNEKAGAVDKAARRSVPVASAAPKKPVLG